MDWQSGYSATYYMTFVDPVTWRDTQRLEITGGSIDRMLSGLRQSASIACDSYPDNTERWIRVYLDAKQGSSNAHEPLFTGLAICPEVQIEGRRQNRDLECYSVLKPASDVYLQRGWYAAAYTSGALIISQLLASCPAPVVVADNSPLLAASIIAEGKETCLTMAEKILTAMNWQLRIEGNGTIHIEPKSTDILATFDPLSYDVVEPSISVESDWYACPNVFMAVSNDLTGIARDDSETSPVSIPNRGREVWMLESNSKLSANESIAEYAMRRLKEEQKIQRTASYDRRFYPDVYPGGRIRLHYPEQGLDGVFAVVSHSIELGYGARTSEQVMEVTE